MSTGISYSFVRRSYAKMSHLGEGGMKEALFRLGALLSFAAAFAWWLSTLGYECEALVGYCGIVNKMSSELRWVITALIAAPGIVLWKWGKDPA
jgi:hypothetical protein